MKSRCRFAVSLVVVAAFGLPAPGQTPQFSVVPVASGLVKPLFVTHAPGDFSRIFIVEQNGQIKIVNLATGALLPTPFLDLTARVTPASNYLEYGVLGLAFHPEYASNGYFYVVYTPGDTSNAQWELHRFRVSANPNVAGTSSQLILRVTYTIRQHRGGWIGFGPDGYLYAATGDGGENDPLNAAADKSLLRGKILRLDVNGPDGMPGTSDDDGFPADAEKHYRIPPDNPFVADPNGADEIWAYGLRNPWRSAFDRETGDLWIADVGQLQREEVNHQPAGSPGGENYGWRCKEGTLNTGLSGSAAPLPSSVAPLHEYPHSGGVGSITGGYVYRGCAIPDAQGLYFFADWSFGKVWTLRRNDGGPPTVTDISSQVSPTGGSGFPSPSSFGEDAFGELYICNWTFSGAIVYKIVPRTFVGPDCNGNGRRDACDVLAGTSPDANHNGVPDECDPPCDEPGVSSSPSGQRVCEGATVVFTVAASGTEPHSYQWRRGPTELVDDGRISGAQSLELTLSDVTSADEGAYACRVSNDCGQTDSAPADLAVCAHADRGDSNGDGVVNFDDIDCFVSALISSAAWSGCGTAAAEYGCANDANCDGAVTFDDIDQFIVCLIGGGC